MRQGLTQGGFAQRETKSVTHHSSCSTHGNIFKWKWRRSTAVKIAFHPSSCPRRQSLALKPPRMSRQTTHARLNARQHDKRAEFAAASRSQMWQTNEGKKRIETTLQKNQRWIQGRRWRATTRLRAERKREKRDKLTWFW